MGRFESIGLVVGEIVHRLTPHSWSHRARRVFARCSTAYVPERERLRSRDVSSMLRSLRKKKSDGEAFFLGESGDEAEEFLGVVVGFGVGQACAGSLFGQGVEASGSAAFGHDEASNADEPGGKAGRIAEGFQRPVGPEERVMRHIFGGIGTRVSGDRTDQADGPVIERAEGRNVSGDRSSNQVVVGRLVAHNSD